MIGSGLSFQSCMSVSFAPVGTTESTLEPRRLGYIGRRLRPLLISEERSRGCPGPLLPHRWLALFRDTSRARLDSSAAAGPLGLRRIKQTVSVWADAAGPSRAPTATARASPLAPPRPRPDPLPRSRLARAVGGEGSQPTRSDLWRHRGSMRPPAVAHNPPEAAWTACDPPGQEPTSREGAG